MKKEARTMTEWTPDARDAMKEIEIILHRVYETYAETWDDTSVQLMMHKALVKTFERREEYVSGKEKDEVAKAQEKLGIFLDIHGGNEATANLIGYTLDDLANFSRGGLTPTRARTVSKRIDAYAKKLIEKP